MINDVDGLFDHFSRALASGTSRREVLRLGVAILGSTVAGALPLKVLAGNGGSSPGAHFCNQLPPGMDRGHCMAEYNRGTGLFYSCGGQIGNLCGQVCCATGESCVNGQCIVVTNRTCQTTPACNVDSDCYQYFGGTGAPNIKCCNGHCAVLYQDQCNCTACGDVCPSGTVCSGPQCVSCGPDLQICTGDSGNGFFKNMDFCSTIGCGSCPPGNVLCGSLCCQAGQSCVNGVCV